MLSEKYSTTATLATSDGWNCKEVPGIPSQRVALLRVMAMGLWGMSTKTSNMMDKNSSGWARPRNRW